MDTTPNAAWIESHTDYLRRLARALLRDSDGAEDAVQETWLKASQAGPVAEGSRRAWLGTVLRNVVRQDWRTAARRSRREQRATRRQEAPSTVHEVARLEQAERLLDALRAMAVEKRHVLEMRYFEGLPPRHIAERLGIPVDTVKTRLRRGLAELRTRLGAEESRDWKQRLALALGLPLGLPWRSVVLPVACGLALVVGATLWSGVFSAPEAPETRSTSTSLAGEATTTLEAAPAARLPVLRGQVAAAAPPAARPPVAGGGAGAAPQAAEVALEVTLVDAAGRPLPPPSGVLHAVLGKNDSGRLVELPVHEGRALVELPPGVRPAFQALAREGGAARVLHPTTHASWEPCESCIVACQLVPPTRLRVLDGETLRDVSELHVLRCTSRIGSSLPRPPEDEVDLSSSVSSPTWLPADADGVKELTAPWRVWAPGYAWRRFEIRAGVDLEQVVHVEPGGRVRVRLEGPRLKVPAQLTVTHVEPGNSSTTTALDVRGPGVHDIEGVPTGPCRLRVQLGDWWDTDRVLGEVTTEIRRGDVSEVTLRYGGTEPPPSVPLAGSLHLPAAWPRKEVLVTFGLQGPALLGQSRQITALRPGKGLTQAKDAPEEYVFDLGSVQAGTYLVELPRTGYRTRIETGPHGTQALRIEVPPPIQVTVKVRGDRGGRTPFLAKLNWRVPLPDETMQVWESAERTSRSEPFRLFVPVGPLHIASQQDDFRGELQDVTVDGRHDKLVLDVKPTALIQLRVRDGERSIPWEFDWPLEVVPRRRGTELLSRSTGLDVIPIRVSGPGTYDLHIGPIDGFEPVEVREVDVGRDLHAEVTVHLTRRP